MSCADMDQEDELDAEEETSVLETKLNIELSREHREHIRFCNVKRKRISFLWRGLMGRL